MGVAGACALLAGACSDPPDDSRRDAAVADAAVVYDAPVVDAQVADGAQPDDAAGPDGPIDAIDYDAIVYDADTTPDATTGSGISMLSDDFESGALDPSWKLFRDDIVDMEVSAGALHITPMFLQQWFNMQQGMFIYKNVSGDFKVTTTARARKDSEPAMAADGIVEMGGLMARKDVPLGGGMQEDYVFVAVGSDGAQTVIETKSTNNGMSFYMGPAFPSGDAELRVCRVGDTFYLYQREVGQTVWVEAASHQRPDMPATVQVGAMVCANDAQPDIRATFDEVVFDEAIDQADCLVD